MSSRDQSKGGYGFKAKERFDKYLDGERESSDRTGCAEGGDSAIGGKIKHGEGRIRETV